MLVETNIFKAFTSFQTGGSTKVGCSMENILGLLISSGFFLLNQGVKSLVKRKLDYSKKQLIVRDYTTFGP